MADEAYEQGKRTLLLRFGDFQLLFGTIDMDSRTNGHLQVVVLEDAWTWQRWCLVMSLSLLSWQAKHV